MLPTHEYNFRTKLPGNNILKIVLRTAYSPVLRDMKGHWRLVRQAFSTTSTRTMLPLTKTFQLKCTPHIYPTNRPSLSPDPTHERCTLTLAHLSSSSSSSSSSSKHNRHREQASGLQGPPLLQWPPRCSRS